MALLAHDRLSKSGTPNGLTSNQAILVTRALE
eukprot:CAMPEP_0201919670 /NCGR_PEP_ID=MMETSP0903-20130614/8493_1 /ASSEMBLY_ACC=CAM_ASM_000552 /TAXON_ID=420261 /ORGANISM="Thalassiosira antarctica, Strain CCMP982" /LENGTH=31 /DNA_ID= /DNA_START= /DNA_END= /DNA_ORIENTATION=